MGLLEMRPLAFTATLILAGFLSFPAYSDTSKLDGAYKPSIETSSSDFACQGLVWDRFSVAGGKLSGGLTHSQAGFMTLSGTVADNGTLQAAKAVGALSTANLKGTLTPDGGSGTWSTSDGRCSGTWSATRR